VTEHRDFRILERTKWLQSIDARSRRSVASIIPRHFEPHLASYANDASACKH